MNTTSLVSKLNNDVLFMIFDTISREIPNSSTSKRPLNTIRAASQVCRLWREVSLASPRIWGRVVDFSDEYHGERRKEWMEEVVTRAGSSTLWITGEIFTPPMNRKLFDKQSYFICLLESWERIEKLSVVLHGEKIPSKIRHRFLSPAPILKVFDVKLRDSLFLDNKRAGASYSLFADYAPLLQEIKTNIVFKLDSPWLSNIHEIFPFSPVLTLQKLFFILQHTPVLETMKIANVREARNQVQDLSSKPLAGRPKLSSISMQNNFQICAAIIDNLSPEKLSFLSMIIEDHAANLKGYALSAFKKRLPLYIFSYFNASPSTIVELIITKETKDTFKFFDIPASIADKQTFEVRVIIRDQSEEEIRVNNIIACLLDMFTLSSARGEAELPFKSVTEMRLNLAGVHPSIIPQLYSMLDIFHHAREIKTKEDSSKILWALLEESIKNGQRVLFPELHTLRLTSLDFDSGDSAAHLTAFITKRKNMGFLLAKLDLTTCSDKSYYCTRDLRVLDTVAGLEVAWKQAGESGEGDEISSYICGTGDPERLSVVLCG